MNNTLKAIRNYKNLRQDELAKTMGKHPSYLGGVENGEKPVNIKTLEGYADAFECSVADLFRIDEVLRSYLSEKAVDLPQPRMLKSGDKIFSCSCGCNTFYESRDGMTHSCTVCNRRF